MRHFSFQTPLLLKTVLVKYILLFHVFGQVYHSALHREKQRDVCMPYLSEFCLCCICQNSSCVVVSFLVGNKI